MENRYVEFEDKCKVYLKEEVLDTENLKPKEVIIKNEASIVSAGTELARMQGMEDGIGFPDRPGYASVGTILRKGEAVTNFEVGEKVIYAGHHQAVERFETGQDHQWGRLYKVPKAVPSNEAVFACLVEIAMIGPVLSNFKINDTVAVFGLGLIGNIACQIFRHMGGRVIALDIDENRCKLARDTGIKTVVHCPPEQQKDRVMEITGDKGVQITVDAVGNSAVVTTCIKATADMGQVLLLGTPRGSKTGDIGMLLHDVHMRGINIKGAHMWQISPFTMRGVNFSVESCYETIYQWMQDGALNVKPLISHYTDPETAPEMYDGLLHKPDKYWGIVFKW